MTHRWIQVSPPANTAGVEALLPPAQEGERSGDAPEWCVPLTEHGVGAAAGRGRGWMPGRGVSCRSRAHCASLAATPRGAPPVVSSGVLPPEVLAWASVEKRGVRLEWYGADCASGLSPLSR